jgi:plasmid stabilization system protein ParE
MKVFFSKRAEEKYASTLDYLRENFGETATKVFKQKAADFIKLLGSFPEMGLVEVESKKIRSFLLTKQTRVFYRITNDKIIILTFFNTYQSPKKKPK